MFQKYLLSLQLFSYFQFSKVVIPLHLQKEARGHIGGFPEKYSSRIGHSALS